MNDLTGQVIKGYVLRELLGVGGFGAVYRAYQPSIEREAAIKAILPSYVNHPEFIRRFESEARLVAQLEHPYIVPLYDFWREPDGAFLVMRFYPLSLYDYLYENGALTLETAVRLVDQITAALVIAHRNHVIHRDLKPENILLDQYGNAYLSDFGIATYLNQDKDLADGPGFTGSVEYAAPEVLQGQPATRQSDIYSLAYVLHRALSGQSIISEKSVNRWVNHHLSDPLPPHEYIPDDVYKVLQKATTKKPEQRYASVVEFAAELHAALSGERIASESIEIALTPDNPYKGLRAFEESDADDFYGRDALTTHLLEQLVEDVPFNRFLAVVGPSGSGKSSLIKAGLVPSLRQGSISDSDNWYYVEMTPGERPCEKLAAALLSVAINPPPDILQQLQRGSEGFSEVLTAILPPGQELLLVIDQFEELFTLVDNEADLALFLNSLYAAITMPDSQLRVIITLRADYYDRPLEYGDFAKLVRNRTEVVVPLSPSEFEQAILRPAQRVGLEVEPRLVAAITADLRGEPGMLPLLQYTLTELFERREGSKLTLKAYQDSGGVRQALAKRAQELYDGMPESHQQLSRQVFLRMVTLGEGIENARRQVLFSELNAMAPDRTALDIVLDTFSKYRLITFDYDPTTREPTTEIAHDALLREWSQLREWLEESRGDIQMQRSLTTACYEWIDAGRREGFLLTGGRLARFEEWSAESTIALGQDEHQFLQASLDERDRLAVIETERLSREIVLEQRAHSRLQILAVVLAVGIIGAVVLSIVAFNQSNKAEDNRNKAEANQREAEAAQEIAEANQKEAETAQEAAQAAQKEAEAARRESDQNALRSLDTALLSYSQLSLYRDRNADLAIALALEAHDIGSLPEQEYRALSEAAYAPGTRRIFTGHTDWVATLDLSQDGTRVLSGSRDMTMRLWDVETGESLRSFPADDPTTEDIIEGHSKEIRDVALSPDERLAASASIDTTARIWDIETGQTLHVLEGHPTYVLGLAFSPDGKILATASETVRLWDVETGALLMTFPADNPDTEVIEGHSKFVRDVIFDAAGNYLISCADDNYVLVWDIQRAEIVRQFDAGAAIFRVNLSPDEHILVMSSYENDVLLWDYETGKQLLTIRGHTASVYDALFTPDGTALLSVSQDKSIRLWNPETGAETWRFIGPTDRVYDAEFLPNGRQFITASFDGTLRLWDMQADAFSRTFEGHEGTVYKAIFNADGTRLLSSGNDQTIRLWDVKSGKQIRIFGPDDPDTEAIEGHSQLVATTTFSPDENYILSSGYDNTICLWDAETGELLRIFGPDDPDTQAIEGHVDIDENYWVWTVAFSSDGKTFYSGAADQTIIRWDIETGKILHQYIGHEGAVMDIELLDGDKHFLTASTDNTIKLWDAESGEIIRVYEGHTGWVWDIALSLNEKTFLTASADKSLILWDLETGDEIRRFVGHNDSVLSVVFNRDESLAISAGRDNLAILWDVQTGELLREYTGHAGWVRDVSYNADLDIFATASGDGTIRFWPIQTFDELIEWTKQNRYVRELTCPEREIYRVEPYCDEPQE